MNEEQKKKIFANIVFLRDNLDAKDILDYFIEKMIFTLDHKDEIVSQIPNTRLKRNDKFLEILMRSGPQAYDVFLYALEQSGSKFIADRINSTVLGGHGELQSI